MFVEVVEENGEPVGKHVGCSILMHISLLLMQQLRRQRRMGENEIFSKKGRLGGIIMYRLQGSF
jgi:hypothetical protein